MDRVDVGRLESERRLETRRAALTKREALNILGVLDKGMRRDGVFEMRGESK